MSGFGFRDVLLVALLGLGVTGQECSWNKDTDFPEFPPIMLDASFEIVRPAMEGDLRVVRVSAGAQLTLACPGSEIANLGSVAVDVTCGGGDLLVVDGTEWRLHELGCTKKDKESIHRNLGSCGDGGAGVFEGIGFEIYGPESFYELIRVCFDPSAETTLYSEHVVRGANIAAKDIDSSRPSFKSSSGFFSDLANTILNPGEQLYFAKGHLAPDADFVTEAEQDATYYYINAVPQWQVFNNGNWKARRILFYFFV
ncbi:deoxyribonuclease I [Penaeus vannamei]|uniref:Deoxyribonuclease I n=1 Tax=Penaeus vannamei TaxID=6689 RepID=A0A423U541_PENVA|nr:deoxyribonuclease I [Penaeus vannamei]